MNHDALTESTELPRNLSVSEHPVVTSTPRIIGSARVERKPVAKARQVTRHRVEDSEEVGMEMNRRK